MTLLCIPMTAALGKFIIVLVVSVFQVVWCIASQTCVPIYRDTHLKQYADYDNTINKYADYDNTINKYTGRYTEDTFSYVQIRAKSASEKKTVGFNFMYQRAVKGQGCQGSLPKSLPL